MSTLGWTVVGVNDYVHPSYIFSTRDEAIREQCWSMGLIEENEMDVDSQEVSRAWRRAKREYGVRAVRVTIEVHPNYRRET